MSPHYVRRARKHLVKPTIRENEWRMLYPKVLRPALSAERGRAGKRLVFLHEHFIARSISRPAFLRFRKLVLKNNV
jgi:hypothetical protein